MVGHFETAWPASACAGRAPFRHVTDRILGVTRNALQGVHRRVDKRFGEMRRVAGAHGRSPGDSDLSLCEGTLGQRGRFDNQVK